MNDLQSCWHAVARAAPIRRRPQRVMFFDQPVVLFNSDDGVAALLDRCPHRHASLSCGRVVNGDIECPYHGWRFNGSGRCTAIPGLTEAVPGYRTLHLQAVEKGGVVFISRGRPSGAPYLHVGEGQRVMLRLVESSTRSSLIDAAENILDATHTHFTHRGLLRGLGGQRQRVRVEMTGGAGWVAARYTGERRQHGIVSRLLEGDRFTTIGRFRYPGIAELEYRGPRGLALATTFHLRQASDQRVEGIGCLVGPAGSPLGYLKACAFRPLFHIALRQDQRVLASACDNQSQAPSAAPLIGPLDFLRRDIEAIMRGELPTAAHCPRTAYIDL